jgi:hypothetical protein
MEPKLISCWTDSAKNVINDRQMSVLCAMAVLPSIETNITLSSVLLRAYSFPPVVNE